MIPPFRLLAAQIGSIVEILGPLPFGEISFRSLSRRPAVVKFPDRSRAALGTVKLKGHEEHSCNLDFGLGNSDFERGGAWPLGDAAWHLKEREVLIDFPGRDLPVIGLPFAGLELDEFVGNHSQSRANHGIAFEFVERLG